MMTMSLGPFDLSGEPFLILYLVLLVAAIIAGVMIPRRMRPEGRRHNVTDPDQLAYLAGGKLRFTDTVVARMLAAGTLVMATKTKFMSGTRPPRMTAAEGSVLHLTAPFGWAAVQRALNPYAEPVARALTGNGLLMSDDAVDRVRWAQTLPYVLLIGFGSIKLLIGEMRERPVGILTVLLIVTAVAAVIRWFVIDRRTGAAMHALADANLRHHRLKIAPTTPEIGIAVALFGTTVLAGSAFSDFHKMRASDSGGSSSSSDSDGGSGCGGGGCGGCGG
jgi:uncharacterized protein (TIGR04222 family)